MSGTEETKTPIWDLKGHFNRMVEKRRQRKAEQAEVKAKFESLLEAIAQKDISAMDAYKDETRFSNGENDCWSQVRELTKAAIKTDDTDVVNWVVENVLEGDVNFQVYEHFGEHHRQYYTLLGYAIREASQNVALALIDNPAADKKLVTYTFDEDSDHSYDQQSAYDYIGNDADTPLLVAAIADYKANAYREAAAQTIEQAAAFDRRAEGFRQLHNSMQARP